MVKQGAISFKYPRTDISPRYDNWIMVEQGAISFKYPRTDISPRFDNWPMVEQYDILWNNMYT